MTQSNAGSKPGTASVGVVVAERLYAGLVENGKLTGGLTAYPATPTVDREGESSLLEIPADALLEEVCKLATSIAKSVKDRIGSVGVALPGFVRQGVVEEAPNLPQLKGARMAEVIRQGLAHSGIQAEVCVSNDADAFAAGLAARFGKLDRHIRVWTLGTGIGFGRYPFAEGIWEGGHTVVTLDDKERYCGCGGRGHMEGIMGHRAMRLRFLDMEPRRVFAEAKKRKGDPRCVEFKRMWHRALAAGTASSIHLDGAGKFFLSGFNTRFLDMPMLKDYLHQMIKMSPLQGYSIEVVDDDQETRVLGAAITAEQAAVGC